MKKLLKSEVCGSVNSARKTWSTTAAGEKKKRKKKEMKNAEREICRRTNTLSKHSTEWSVSKIGLNSKNCNYFTPLYNNNYGFKILPILHDNFSYIIFFII